MRKIFEEYIESADYKVTTFFKELRSQIETWFEKGSLAAQGCDLDGEIQISNYNPMEKFLIVNFVESVLEGEEEDGSSLRYRMIFMIRLNEMESENNIQEEGEMSPEGQKNLEINKVLLKIYQFSEDNVEKGELVEEVDVEYIKEDFIIDKIGQLKDKSDSGELDVK